MSGIVLGSVSYWPNYDLNIFLDLSLKQQYPSFSQMAKFHSVSSMELSYIS